jgi:hypothetical protein
MFHDASAAFVRPARNPTRGSGLGGLVDIEDTVEDAGDGLPPDEDAEDEHAAAASRPSRIVPVESAAALNPLPPRHLIDWAITANTPSSGD